MKENRNRKQTIFYFEEDKLISPKLTLRKIKLGGTHPKNILYYRRITYNFELTLAGCASPCNSATHRRHSRSLVASY